MADKNTENIKFSKEQVENVKEFNKAFRDVNAEINDLFSGLNSISDEIKGQVQGYQLANKAVTSLTGVFGTLKDIQANIKTANSKDLKTLQEKALSEKKNLEQAQRLLKEKATTVGLSEKEVATLANVNGLLEEQEGLYQNIESTLSQVVQNEKILEETTGTLGALTEGFSKGLKKAGLGAIEAKLGLGAALQSTKDMVAAGEGNVSKMQAAGHLAKQLGSNLIKSVGPAVLLSAAFTKLVSAFKEVDKLSGDTAKELGISYEEAQGLTFEMNQASSYSKDLQNNTAGLMKAQSSLNSMFGTSVEFSGEMAKEFDSVQKRLKLSDESMGSFTKLGLLNGESLKDNLNTVNKTLLQQNQQNKTSFSQKQIQESIGKASSATRLQLKGSTEELVRAAVNAKKLGLEIEDLGKTSSALLDFESSISSELEAELLTGKDLNLERARTAALNGDNATLAAEMAKQIGTAADFGKMNVIQQEALAKAFGMGREDLAKMLEAQQNQQQLSALGFDNLNEAQEEYNKMVAEGATQSQLDARFKDEALTSQLESVSQQEKLAAITDRLQEAFISLIEPVMAFTEPLVNLVGVVLTPIVASIQGIKDIMTSLFDPTKSLMDSFKEMGPLVSGIATALTIAGIAVTASLVPGLIRAGAAALMALPTMIGNAVAAISAASATTLGIGTIAIIGGIVAAVAAMKSASSDAQSIKDGMIDPKGGLVVSGEKGTFKLDPNDSVIAGTDLNKPNPSLANNVNPINLDPLIERINALISVVEKGGNIYLDGTKVGTAMNVSTYKVQ
jgi:hypothetical protein